jgi:hypothetical protein
MGEMKTRCPLPIDWLDFVETGQPESLAAHLDDCASCRVYVDSLRRQAAVDDLGDWLNGLDLDSAVVWRPRPLTSAAFGMLVLNAAAYEDDEAGYSNVWRLPFVVIDDGRAIDGRRWFQVAPVDTDVENASSTDLLLRPDESEVGLPLRVIFSLQTTLAEEQIADEVGRLTTAGGDTLHQAIAGELDDMRYGLPLTGPDDERLSADRELEEVVRHLRSPFFALAPHDASELVEDDLPERVALGAESERGGRLFYFNLNRLRASGGQLALAAQTEPTQWVYHASLRTEMGEIEGELRFDLWRDTLLFFIERLEGFQSAIQLVVESRGEQIESESFVPQAGEEVEVASVLLPDVEKIAARID